MGRMGLGCLVAIVVVLIIGGIWYVGARNNFVTLDDFANFAASKDIAPIADIRDALQKPNDRRYIERALKAEIIAAKYGYDASYPYRLQGDNQVEKALELFPEAQKLAMQASEAQSHSQPGANNAGSRAASNSGAPKTQ